jgi:SAM-dependent methyltransferase
MNQEGFNYFEGRIAEIYSIFYCRRYDWDYIVNFIDASIFQELNIKVKDILDCACGGCGEPAITLWRKKFNVCCSDGSKVMLEAAKKKIGEVKANVEFIDTPLLWHNLNQFFEGRRFDAVVCLANSISHVHPNDLDLNLKNMLGLTRDGGVLIIDAKRYSPDGRELHFEIGRGLVERTTMSLGKGKLSNGKAVEMFTEVLYNQDQPNIETIRVTLDYGDGPKWVEDCSFWKYGQPEIARAFERIGVPASYSHVSDEPPIEIWKYELTWVVKDL